MKHGARNQIRGTVESLEEGGIMALAKVRAKGEFVLSSVLTRESAKELQLKKGDTVTVIVKAVNVLLAKD